MQGEEAGKEHVVREGEGDGEKEGEKGGECVPLSVLAEPIVTVSQLSSHVLRTSYVPHAGYQVGSDSDSAMHHALDAQYIMSGCQAGSDPMAN